MRTKFSEGQIEKLRLNPCVFNCTTNSINFFVFDFYSIYANLNNMIINIYK